MNFNDLSGYRISCHYIHVTSSLFTIHCFNGYLEVRYEASCFNFISYLRYFASVRGITKLTIWIWRSTVWGNRGTGRSNAGAEGINSVRCGDYFGFGLT